MPGTPLYLKALGCDCVLYYIPVINNGGCNGMLRYFIGSRGDCMLSCILLFLMI